MASPYLRYEMQPTWEILYLVSMGDAIARFRNLRAPLSGQFETWERRLPAGFYAHRNRFTAY